MYTYTCFRSNTPVSSRRPLDKLLYDLHRPLKLHLLLLGRLHGARAAPTTRRAAIHPHEVVAPKGDTRVEPVDVLTAGRLLRRKALKDIVQLADERGGSGVGRRERLALFVSQGGRTVGPHGGGDAPGWLRGRAGDRVDRARCGRGEPAGDAWWGRVGCQSGYVRAIGIDCANRVVGGERTQWGP